MRKFRITYQPFTTSSVTSSDCVLHAEDETEVRRVFERIYPQWVFVSAKEGE